MERWTEGEITALRANQRLSPYQLSFIVQTRTPQQIAQRLSTDKWPWTEGEVGVLITDGRYVPDSQIAKRLGRTTDAVKSKRSSLGILKADISLYERIPVEPGPAKPPGLTESHWGSNGEEEERGWLTMMFLSRLDEFDTEGLDNLQIALDAARRGRELMKELAP